MKELLIYTLAGLGGLVVLGYSVHMFIGGLVSPETEFMAIALVCLIGALCLAYMAWDVIQRRRG
jgi:threonine/homoserine/homoserine lactone efflux protein